MSNHRSIDRYTVSRPLHDRNSCAENILWCECRHHQRGVRTLSSWSAYQLRPGADRRSSRRGCASNTTLTRTSSASGSGCCRGSNRAWQRSPVREITLIRVEWAAGRRQAARDYFRRRTTGWSFRHERRSSESLDFAMPAITTSSVHAHGWPSSDQAKPCPERWRRTEGRPPQFKLRDAPMGIKTSGIICLG
jgi:hypothetical protein